MRWWYGITWPTPSSTPVPPGYEPLPAFPGMYLSTAGADVGKILDTRDPDACPCFDNMVKKTATELRSILVECVAGQGEECDDEGIRKELEKLKKWAEKVSASTITPRAPLLAKWGGMND